MQHVGLARGRLQEGAGAQPVRAHAQVEEALQIFEDMLARGCERNVITYSSLVSACEKAGRWQLALELLDSMHRDACKPNAVTFNALISACAQGAPGHTFSSIRMPCSRSAGCARLPARSAVACAC